MHHFSLTYFLKNIPNCPCCDTHVWFRKECKISDLSPILHSENLKFCKVYSAQLTVLHNISAGTGRMKDNSAVVGAVRSGLCMILNCVSLEVFTAVQMRIPVFWDVMGSVHLTLRMNWPCDAASHSRRPESV